MTKGQKIVADFIIDFHDRERFAARIDAAIAEEVAEKRGLIRDLTTALENKNRSSAAAIAEEREACAKMAESEPEYPGPMPHHHPLREMPLPEALRQAARSTKRNIAAAIRARGK